jgi:membrane protease YdiL (CAAX protease family)
VFAGLAAFLVLVLIEAVIVAAVDGDTEELSLAATLVLQAMLAVTLVVVAFVVARPDSGEVSAADLGLRRPLHPAVKLSVLAYLAYIGCALLIAAIIQPEQEDVTRDLGADEGALGSIAAGFLVIFAAPITEEVFFRGFMFAGLRRAMPFAGAALLSAGIWGIFHYTGGGSWGVVLQLAIFGVALAWLYERTGSIWPTIAVHALNNALAFAILTS